MTGGEFHSSVKFTYQGVMSETPFARENFFEYIYTRRKSAFIFKITERNTSPTAFNSHF